MFSQLMDFSSEADADLTDFINITFHYPARYQAAGALPPRFRFDGNLGKGSKSENQTT